MYIFRVLEITVEIQIRQSNCIADKKFQELVFHFADKTLVNFSSMNRILRKNILF